MKKVFTSLASTAMMAILADRRQLKVLALLPSLRCSCTRFCWRRLLHYTRLLHVLVDMILNRWCSSFIIWAIFSDDTWLQLNLADDWRNSPKRTTSGKWRDGTISASFPFHALRHRSLSQYITVGEIWLCLPVLSYPLRVTESSCKGNRWELKDSGSCWRSQEEEYPWRL